MRARILFATVCVTLLSVILMTFGLLDTAHNTIIERGKESLTSYYNLISKNPIEPTESYVYDLQRNLKDSKIYVYDIQGKLLANTENQTNGEVIFSSEEIEALANGSLFNSKTDTTNSEILYIQGIINNNIIEIGTPMPTEIELLFEMTPTLLWLTFVHIIICFFTTYVGTFFILKPIEDLAKKSSTHSAITTEYIEFKPIADILNNRNATIDRKISQLKEEKQLVVELKESKDEFISNITHEMNTPLTSIMGFSELLELGTLNSEQQKKAVKAIKTQSERLTNLIRCILNYTEIDNDHLPNYEVNISKIYYELIESLLPALEKKQITLNSFVDKDVTILSRHEIIQQLLGNLIRNAIHYNKLGGSITVTIRGGENGYFQISDTGIGIAKDNLDKIFSRFFTVDKSHNGKNGGFGLGLAVVRKHCRKAGWKLTVDSELDLGTTFTIDFNN